VTVKQVSRKGDRIIAQLNVSPSTRVSDLKKELQSKSKLSVDRQRLTLGTERGAIVLDDQKSLSDYTLTNGELYLKDLGPQISWKGVFLIEYFGPLLLYTILYLRPTFIYGKIYGPETHPVHFVQHLAFGCWVAHYVKRELETLFVHRFSHGTMPLSNLFKNSSYYWGFALLIAYFVNHPLYTPPAQPLVILGFVIFVVNEIGNLITHLILRNLRPPGSKERRIPRTFLFEYVSCPNYFCEILAWIGFSIMTQSLACVLFTIFGAVQMLDWANKKHALYKKDFPDYPKNRKILFPFIY